MAKLDVSLNLDERVIDIINNPQQFNAQGQLNLCQTEVATAQKEIQILQEEISNAQRLFGEAQEAIRRTNG